MRPRLTLGVAEETARASVVWLERVLPLVVQVLGFAALYQRIPNCPLRWRHCMAGGVLAGGFWRR